nr:10713_t:CDS:1 [Entrophospora candida]
MCMDEILLCVYKAQLDSDQTRLLFNPPCQLHVQMIQLISPNPNNVDSVDIPKPQNCFFLYRKNYNAKHKSLESKKDWKTLSKEAGNSWKNESDEVKRYFKILAMLAFEKHKLIYESIVQLPKSYIFISQGSESQQETNDNNANYVDSSSYHLHTNYNTSSFYQQQELLQEEMDDNDNSNFAVSTLSYTHPFFSSFISNNPSSLSYTSFNPSASFLPYSTFNPLPINDDNFINNTNASPQPAKFNTTMDLNYDEILSKGSECLPDKQMNKRFKFKSVNF